MAKLAIQRVRSNTDLKKKSLSEKKPRTFGNWRESQKLGRTDGTGVTHLPQRAPPSEIEGPMTAPLRSSSASLTTLLLCGTLGACTGVVAPVGGTGATVGTGSGGGSGTASGGTGVGTGSGGT